MLQIARPITCDTARECHFHDALDTLLRRAFDRHTWSIEYRCVVYQHRRGLYPDQWEATCLMRRPNDGLDLKYYPRRSTGNAGGVIASPVGEGNPMLNSMVNLAACSTQSWIMPSTSWARFGRRLRNCVLSAQHATIWMVVLPPLSGFSTLTVRRPMVASTMVPQTV
jgi:hypothetical protein